MIITSLLHIIKKSYYRFRGVSLESGCKIALKNFTIIDDCRNIYLKKNAEINAGCFLVGRDKIVIGENSTLAYRVTILTTANPNGPCNKLAEIYKPMTAPVIVEDNVWIGAGSIILPGGTIGSMSVVAAGAVVTKDVPSGVLVAGIPAKVVKKIV